VLAGRVRVLVVGRSEVRDSIADALTELGIEFEFASNGPGAARLCLERRFELALVDAGLKRPADVLSSLDLRGRRLRRSVVVFSDGNASPGFAKLDAEPVPVGDAGAAVLALLEAGAVSE
jgi:CheY-like chemotaxis protein